MEINPLMCLRLRNNRDRRAKSSSKVNRGNDDSRTQNPFLTKRKLNGFGHTGLYGQNG